MGKIVVQNFLLTFTSKGLGFIITLYFAKKLSVDDYGFYSSINLVLLYLPFLHFGLMNGTSIELPKFVNNYSKKRISDFYVTHFISSSAIQIISGLFIFIILFFYYGKFSAQYNDTNLVSLSLYVFLYFFFSKFGENIRLYFLSNLKLETNNLFRIFTDITPPLAAFLVFYYVNKIEGIFLGYTLAFSAVFVFAVFFVLRMILKNGYSFKFFLPFLKKIYRTGFPIFLTWVLDTIFRSIDRYSIMLFYSKDNFVDLANYSFINNISSILLLAAISLSSPYGQVLYKHIALNKRKEAHKTIRKANRQIIIMGVVLSVIIILAFEPITNFTGKYGENRNLLLAMLPIHFLMGITSLLVYFFTSTYNAKTLLKYQLIALVTNVILNAIVIIKELDIIYFAFTTLITVIIYFIQVSLFVRKDARKY